MVEDTKMKNAKYMIGIVLATVLIATVLSGCVEEETPEEVTVIVTGSTTVLPIATQTAEQFNAMYDNITVTVSGGGSGHGITSVATGDAHIGMASREIKQSEIDENPEVDFVDHVVALDGVAVIVSLEISNNVTDITMDQLKGIYNGTITNWQELGGPDAQIYVNEREEGSGTRDTFMEIVDLEETTQDATAHSANSQVKQEVAASDVAIGYVGLGYVGDDTPALMIDGVAPSAATIADGTYPISRSLHMYTDGEATGALKMYLDYVMGAEGQAIVEEEGFITL
jgi:phosphate transport system substrate-binding protein